MEGGLLVLLLGLFIAPWNFSADALDRGDKWGMLLELQVLKVHQYIL